jgi:glycosyltransferase involved in cell wall biosynthesis
MSLSVCMITKNDGDTIKASLESVRSIAHEIVIVDVGSSDKTLEIVKKFEQENNVQCKIVHHIWDHHFSKARNIALRNASCHWILMMEPNERVKHADLNAIKSCMQDDQFVGYYLHKTMDENDPGVDNLSHISKQMIKNKKHIFVPDLRLFRNHEMVKYNGIINETVEDSLRALGQSFKTNIVLEK